MSESEWYFDVGYVELLYTALVVCIFVALFFFARSHRKSDLATNVIEENSPLLGLIALAIVLFIVNRLLGDLW
ncbi:MAG: hypothetical protein H0X43_02480 [Nitrosospira sp.]|nr:hypothetical protein [Nitrosospira sp.]